MLNDYLTARQAAQKSGYHYGYIRLLLARGIIPSLKLGNMRLVRAEDIKAYKSKIGRKK